MDKKINLPPKRLLFSVMEDSYFLTYNIIIILGALNCMVNNKKYFTDIRKFNLLITIISKSTYTNVINKVLNNEVLTDVEKELLFGIYYENQLMYRSINSIIFSLEQKNIIKLERKGKQIAAQLINKDFYDKCKNTKLFKTEINEYEFIFKKIKKFNIITNETFESSVFKLIEEGLWDI